MRFFPTASRSRSCGVDRFPLRAAPARGARGFSLIESLAVLAIIAILGVLSVPSLIGMTSSGKFNGAISSLNDTLNLARQTAVARNTYVWVAFSVPSSPTDPLATLVVASADGTNPFATGWSGTVELPNAGFLQVTPSKSSPQCQFIEAGALTSRQIPGLPSTAAAAQNGLGTDLAFTLMSPTGLRKKYTRVIVYSPSGQAYNGLNQVNFIEFGIQPGVAPTALIGRDVAVLRVSFMTGKSTLYRP